MVGDGQMVHRLAEMGIRLGVRLQIIRHGKTSLIAIEGRKFSLRAVDLEEILVEVSANSNEVLS
jgi:Fe2+ transport system protein FeoA